MHEYDRRAGENEIDDREVPFRQSVESGTKMVLVSHYASMCRAKRLPPVRDSDIAVDECRQL
jgi:hypothetical protein